MYVCDIAPHLHVEVESSVLPAFVGTGPRLEFRARGLGGSRNSASTRFRSLVSMLTVETFQAEGTNVFPVIPRIHRTIYRSWHLPVAEAGTAADGAMCQRLPVHFFRLKNVCSGFLYFANSFRRGAHTA